MHTERWQPRRTILSETYLEKHIGVWICNTVWLVVATFIKYLDSQFHWEKCLLIIRNLKWDYIYFFLHLLIHHMTCINLKKNYTGHHLLQLSNVITPPHQFAMCIFKHFISCWWYTREWHETLGYNKNLRLADKVETDKKFVYENNLLQCLRKIKLGNVTERKYTCVWFCRMLLY